VHRNKKQPLMSEKGETRSFGDLGSISGFTSKADLDLGVNEHKLVSHAARNSAGQYLLGFFGNPADDFGARRDVVSEPGIIKPLP
jgi:hypothetical protein